MTTKAPTVSVVIPTYNRRRLLQEAVASVVAQTFGDWELIVVDDGSTDGTRKTLTKISRQDDRVRPIFLPRSGNPSRVRNAGIRQARGASVAFLDSDDLWEPGKLQAQVEGIAHEDRFRWSYTGFRLVDDEGSEIPLGAGRPWHPRSGDLLPELLSTRAAAPIQTILVEMSLLREVGLFDEGLPYKEDYELVLRLAARSEAHAVEPKLVSIREHPGRSTKLREDGHEWSLRIYEGFRERSLDPEHRRLCDERCAYHLLGIARDRLEAGSYRLALRFLARAFPYAPASVRWWRAAVKWALLSVARILRLR